MIEKDKLFVTIPGSDLKTYSICLGTGGMGSTIAKSDAFTMLDIYHERGGNFLDSAKIYADWLPGERSVSEKTIGAWIKQRGNRSQIILATKGAHPDLATMQIARLSRPEIEADLNASLQHLQTDTIDLYWLHRDDPSRPVEDILETLHAQKQAGKIRYFGCSNWRASRIRAANAYATSQGWPGFIANQMMWNLAVVDPLKMYDPTIVVMDDDLRAYHHSTGLAAIPFSATANGLFNKLANVAGDLSRAGRLPGIYALPASLQRYQRIERMMTWTSLSVTQIVLGYLKSQPFPTIPIVGPRDIEQLVDCLSAAQVRLTSYQIKYLEQG